MLEHLEDVLAQKINKKDKKCSSPPKKEQNKQKKKTKQGLEYSLS